jgi:hypothetical protein
LDAVFYSFSILKKPILIIIELLYCLNHAFRKDLGVFPLSALFAILLKTRLYLLRSSSFFENCISLSHDPKCVCQFFSKVTQFLKL